MKSKKCLMEALKCYYEPPKAERKKAFMRQIRRGKKSMPELDLWYMLRVQCRYVSKWIWVGSAAFFFLSLLAGTYIEHKYIGEVFAMIPLLVMLTILESVRSCRYGMEELEMAARFSLKSIIFMRLILLGVVNLFVMLLAVAFMKHADFTVVLYMLTPYLVTALGGLRIVRVYRGKEGVYMCAAFACVVAVMEGILPFGIPGLFEGGYLTLWFIGCVVCMVLVVKECYRLAQAAAMGFEG